MEVIHKFDITKQLWNSRDQRYIKYPVKPEMIISGINFGGLKLQYSGNKPYLDPFDNSATLTFELDPQEPVISGSKIVYELKNGNKTEHLIGDMILNKFVRTFTISRLEDFNFIEYHANNTGSKPRILRIQTISKTGENGNLLR
jgi:hypothetical protein